MKTDNELIAEFIPEFIKIPGLLDEWSLVVESMRKTKIFYAEIESLKDLI